MRRLDFGRSGARDCSTRTTVRWPASCSARDGRDPETALANEDAQIVGWGGLTLKVVTEVGWFPANTSAITCEDPAAQERPKKTKTALPSSSRVDWLVPPKALLHVEVLMQRASSCAELISTGCSAKTGFAST